MADVQLTAISPIFQVANLARGLDFYKRVMGFKVAWQWGDPPDRASLCRDAVEITLEVEASPVSAHVYIVVREIDSYFAHISSTGARVSHTLADRVYGMRDCRIVDPDGNQLSIGQSLHAS